MLFNSIDFAVFLPVVFLLYWFVAGKSRQLQNALVVVASYVFYGWWDWRFLSLILASTLVDYFIGNALAATETRNKRKLLLWLSIGVNLGALGFFKYYNFFVDNFVQAFSLFGTQIQPNTLDIILPVGISFYTFQTLSYTIDVYRRTMQPTRNFVAFAAYVSFFPQLVAGPIERASRLLPQFERNRTFDPAKASDGLRQMLWGLFKKLVIADNCAELVNIIFADPESMNGSALLVGAILFAFQIYGDFSGYSDIAIGTARLFGFDLMQNFAFPYFSRDISEFWRRWHISLSSWFRDYVYIPLGGSRVGQAAVIRNVFVIFVVSGIWHGAEWTFAVWGLLNALYFLPLLIAQRNRVNMAVVAQNKVFPKVREVLSILGTFGLTVFAWIFFRAENMGQALAYTSGLFSWSLFAAPDFPRADETTLLTVLLLLFIVTEWFGRERHYAIERLLLPQPRALRWAFYCMVVVCIGLFMNADGTAFIYFQF